MAQSPTEVSESVRTGATPTIKPIPPFPPPNALPVYALTYTLARAYYTPAARLRVEGGEYVPMESGAVVVCNHTRGNDYFPLGMATPRQLFYMVKAEAFDFHPLLARIMRAGGCFPVARGLHDADALAMAVEIVRSGKLLGMFPEGHRSPDGKLQKVRTGATRIALEAEALVVPAAVIGAEAGFRNFPRFWARTEVLVRFGEPYRLEGRSGERAAVVAGTKRIMRSIAALLPPEMRGAYA